MGQALWRLPPRQQQQLQEELADRLSERGGGGEKQEQGNSAIFTSVLLYMYIIQFNIGGNCLLFQGGYEVGHSTVQC